MHNLMRYLLCLFAIASSQSFASKDPCPPVTEISLVGVWEAVYTEDSVRVFRLEVNSNGKAILSQGIAVSPSEGIGQFSELESKSIENGEFDLIFTQQIQAGTENNGKPHAQNGEQKLSGIGYSCGNAGGVLDAELVMGQASLFPKKWKLRFIKSVNGVSLTEHLFNLHNAALPITSRKHQKLP